LTKGHCRTWVDRSSTLPTRLLRQIGFLKGRLTPCSLTYSDIFTVIYPVWLGWVMMTMAAGGLVLVVRQDGTDGLTAGAGRMLALILGSAVILFCAQPLIAWPCARQLL